MPGKSWNTGTNSLDCRSYEDKKKGILQAVINNINVSYALLEYFECSLWITIYAEKTENKLEVSPH